MLELLIVIGRALALALRGHRELVLENLALRQQLTAMKRTTKRPRLQTRDRLFWIALRSTSGGTGARRWCSCSRTPSCGGIATGSAADGPDVRDPDRTAVHRSISRSAPSSERWRRRIRCGERRGFMANCARSVSTSQSARCRVCWNGTHVRLRKRGGRSSRITSRQPRRWISSPCRRSPAGCCSSWSCCRIIAGASCMSTSRSIRPPTWTAQQVVDAFPDDTAPRWLHRIATASTATSSGADVAGMGIAEVVSAPASPWQNPYVERVIGSIRRECLDHVIVLNEPHLRRVLAAYLLYYNDVSYCPTSLCA